MPLPDSFQLSAFLTRIDEHPELRGARVVYFDGMRMHVLREGPPYCAPELKAVVIRERIELTALQNAQATEHRDGRLLTELLGVGLSCSAALLGWSVVLGSTGAAPLTGGTSAFVAYLALGAASASSIQCFNSLARTAAEVYVPEKLDVLDSQEWYVKTSLALDALSLAGAVTAGAATIRLAVHLRATTGRGMVQVLRGLTRQQRARLAEEAIRIQHPRISAGHLKSFIRAGVYPKRFTKLAIGQSVRSQLLDAAGAAFSLAGSATAGVARELVIGLAYAIETHR